jgi:PucR C-terminal helix-turn-helix domain
MAERGQNPGWRGGMPKLTDLTGAWPAVPPGAAEFILTDLDHAAEEMIGAIQREVPEYARPHDDSYARTVHRAVHQALHQFVQQIDDPATSREGTARLFRDIGRIESTEGRSLEPLQIALRLGARVAWRRLCDKAARGILGTDALGAIGESIFLYLDELAAACAEGFMQAGAEVADEMQRRRLQLLDLIVADPPASREAVADRARAAGWALPRKIAVVALADRSQDFLPLPALPPEVLTDVLRADPCLLVPDPDGPGRVDLIERGLRGWTGALGPAVPLSQASSSLRWARQALALARRGIVGPNHGLIRCDEHLSTLLIFADEDLARVCAATRLAPLARLRPAQQDTLAETLLAWLQSAGNARIAARQLHVHPQTVRYRLRQIQELFGEALAEPAARFDLEVALRAHLLLRDAISAEPPQRVAVRAGKAGRPDIASAEGQRSAAADPGASDPGAADPGGPDPGAPALGAPAPLVTRVTNGASAMCDHSAEARSLSV